MRRTAAWAMLVIGIVVAVVGVALLSIPLALILAGAGIAALGLVAVEVSP